MLQIPLDLQTKLFRSIDDLTVASQTIVRTADLPNSAFRAAFGEFRMGVFQDQMARDASYPSNMVVGIAQEMFRNSWYHGPRPANIESHFWYNLESCVFGICDGGQYFREASVKQMWESAHAVKNHKGVGTTVRDALSVHSPDYGGGASMGSAQALHAPYLQVDIDQGALFLGFRNDEISN
jgi:hypothetical protein